MKKIKFNVTVKESSGMEWQISQENDQGVFEDFELVVKLT